MRFPLPTLIICSLLFSCFCFTVSCDFQAEGKPLPQQKKNKQKPPLLELKGGGGGEEDEEEEKNQWKFSSLEKGPWQKEAIRYAYQVIENYFNPSRTLIDNPLLNTKEFEYERIYFTIYVKNHIRGCQSSANPNMQKAVKEAVIRTLEDERFKGVLKREEVKDIFVAFNIVKDRRPINSRTAEGIAKELDLGLEGITVTRGRNRAFFKESVFINFNYNINNLLKRLCLKAGLEENAFTSEATQFYAHKMMSFAGDRTNEPIDLFRYKVLVDLNDVNATEVIRRMKLARNWLLDKRSEYYGFLYYEYLPTHNHFPDTNSNIRQMGTLWSIAKYANAYQDTEMMELAKEGLDYFLDYQVKKKEGKLIILLPNDAAKIAYNAFLLLALCEVPEYPLREKIMDGLYKALAGQQRPDGGFDTIFGEQTDKGIDFYPGEALTAMAAYAKTEDKPEAYEVMAKAFPYYSNYFRNNKRTAFVPWHSQAYTALYLHTLDSKYADFVFEINDWIIDTHQIQKNPKHPDMLGGFRENPNYSTTAFSEGIACALHLANSIRDQKHIQKYQESFTLALRFIFQLQFDNQDIFYLKAPEKALGGIKTSLVNSMQRIDMTQHFIHALQMSDKFKLLK